ncbi:TPA: CS19 fimbria tip adhesin CsdD, partial [Escherichia coli]|nr:CS19 fimbria tip adhesin CsdD [Escherichia coli]
SDSMVIKFQDDNPTNSSEYNLYKIGGTEKLPYAVSLLMGEKIFYPVNGQSFTINDSSVLETNWNRVTAVAMPEVNVPVLCWPARLLLNADVNAPDAGQYSGQIYITFTPSVENL